jgi:phosphoribosyl-ATP pyrophosphohydrolase/phosphoribosyl-AMP cyclohydrolase
MIKPERADWEKGNGLLPAIIQDAEEKTLLMLGYMSKESLEKTQKSEKVTFFSRSKNRLWEKGETSGNTLHFVSAELDCDNDTILIQARPSGPVCHTGAKTCFGEDKKTCVTFLEKLSATIKSRKKEKLENSYVAMLFQQGSKRIAQKVGEEGVELSIAHARGDKEEVLNEAADLIFHTLVLLEDAELTINDVCQNLRERHRS